MAPLNRIGSRAVYVSGRGPGSRWAGAQLVLPGALAIGLLVATGIAYRATAARLRMMHENPIKLDIPLSAIPLHIGPWVGQDVQQEAMTDDFMRRNFADDYIGRHYVNVAEGSAAGVYVVYCASRPSGLLGHRPDVCYPATGWIRERKPEPTEIICRSGRKIECLSHRFYRNEPVYEQKYVLSFYVLNGQITVTEREFSGFWDRSPNLAGDPARYVAQVQISSALESAARLAAGDLVETILMFLPDRHGRVRAAVPQETSVD
jgi:hypothetical protein